VHSREFQAEENLFPHLETGQAYLNNSEDRAQCTGHRLRDTVASFLTSASTGNYGLKATTVL